jgi:Stress responsive A/B Barrel Domain
MIKHIVMWTLKDHAEGADKAANLKLVAAKLESCRGIVPGMRAFEVLTSAPAGLEFTADIALYAEFDDQAALQAYQTHAAHKAIGPFVGAVRLTRNCLDVEV